MTDEHENDRKPVPEEESLNRALDTLEQMLDARHADDTETPEPVEAGPGGAQVSGDSDGQTASRPESAGDGTALEGQYTIPLLDDVVLPGTQPPPSDAADDPRLEASPPSLNDDEDCRRLVQRLTSELEVIIQTGIEEALRKATKSIGRQVKEHIDIMLPEILEEIARMKDRNDP